MQNESASDCCLVLHKKTPERIDFAVGPYFCVQKIVALHSLPSPLQLVQ
jgi:hypothetical protein